ncbi:MAG: hypothetical protein ACXVDF_19385 [Ktedonobacterales bacterium]
MSIADLVAGILADVAGDIGGAADSGGFGVRSVSLPSGIAVFAAISNLLW